MAIFIKHNFLVKLYFIATQETRSLPITFTFFLPLILRIVRVASSWCFTLYLIHFWIVYVLSFFSLSLVTFERSSHRRSSNKKSFLKFFAKLTAKCLCQSRPEQVFSCDFYEVLYNTFFIKHFQAPALSLLLEKPFLWVFLFFNLPDAYLLVF